MLLQSVPTPLTLKVMACMAPAKTHYLQFSAFVTKHPTIWWLWCLSQFRVGSCFACLFSSHSVELRPSTWVTAALRHVLLWLEYDLDCLRSVISTRRMRTCFGDYAFNAAGPRRWTGLPSTVRSADSIDFQIQTQDIISFLNHTQLVISCSVGRPYNGMIMLRHNINRVIYLAMLLLLLSMKWSVKTVKAPCW